jgi:putative Holliday junction resolvase
MSRSLGIDLGDARIGLAISDDLGILAHPLETLQVKGPISALDRIAQIIEREKVGTVVIGMPRHMDGTYGPAAEKAKTFAAELGKRVSAAIRFQDERLTSVAAQRSLHDAGRNVKQSRAVIDQVAAQMILQSHLDAAVGEGTGKMTKDE